MNEFLIRRLSAPAVGLSVSADALALLTRAHELVGDRLLGLVAYGSWARGEAAALSDVDVLVVVEPTVKFTRDLYRHWDRAPVRWQGRPVDPHFVTLPTADDAVSGLWCEAAVDGVVLFERDARLSAALARIRRAIAEGRIVRRTSHGQPYWTAA